MCVRQCVFLQSSRLSKDSVIFNEFSVRFSLFLTQQVDKLGILTDKAASLLGCYISKFPNFSIIQVLGQILLCLQVAILCIVGSLAALWSLAIKFPQRLSSYDNPNVFRCCEMSPREGGEWGGLEPVESHCYIEKSSAFQCYKYYHILSQQSEYT